MAPTVLLSEWVAVTQREYLNEFISAGGSALKFAVVTDDTKSADLVRALRRRMDDERFLMVCIDAAVTRVHMIDHVFFAVAEQVPWPETVERVLAGLVTEKGYPAPESGPEPFVERLSRSSGLGPAILQTELRTLIEREVFKNRRLMKDFRVAMMQLARVQLTGGPEAETTVGVIRDWLTGRNKAVSAVKPYQIFNRINRSNARYMLESLCVWLRMSGYAGLLVLIDLSRLAIPRNPRDERVFYSKAMLLDAYEVLRQFIDGLDRLEGCFLVVAADATFLDDADTGRGLQAYQALRFRVYDEVRDRDRANPLASLVRLNVDAIEGQA